MENYKVAPIKSEAYGGKIEKIEDSVKHHYILFLGSKTQKKDMRKSRKWEVLPYPKGDNIRYDTSAKINTQELLF